VRITILNGFFLPVPPVGGGSTEKTWFRLGREFAARGHTVVSISRHWSGFPSGETIDGVRHIRLRGHDHTPIRWRNLLHDFFWSLRAGRVLPPADIVICHAVTLPLWLGRRKPAAGRVVVMAGRIPKGQYRRYHHVARVLAPSAFVRDRVVAENPALAPAIRVTGYPINWSLLNDDQITSPPFGAASLAPGELVIGYAGRIHEEKGLILLADALKLVAQAPGLPPWRLVLCGPSDIARGGSGAAFRSRLLQRLAQSTNSERFHLLDPQFNERMLAGTYRQMNVFCYPSLAAEGETFGVAVAEAMAAGAVPVVSSLDCFRELVRDGENGLVFDHAASDAPARLAAALVRVLQDAALRARLAATARADSRRYDFPVFAEALLADFTELTRS
jgi:glycosyltransferase involved in cell wall biosynthesis